VSATKRTVMRKRALVMGLWIISCAIVFVSVLAAPPARGQAPGNGCVDQTKRGCSGWWSPEGDEQRYPRGYGELRVVESAGEVVMKFTTEEPGRTEYYTNDGDCSGYPTAEDPANDTPVSPDECGRPYARAGEDYGAVRGQWTFTEAGSRTIRIPIFDDDRDETDREPFTINAAHWPDGWPSWVLYNATIAIMDDDPSSSSGSSSSAQSSSQARIGRQAGTGGATPPLQTETRPTGVSRPDRDAASTELRPGPGFELIGSQAAARGLGESRSQSGTTERGSVWKLVFLTIAGMLAFGGAVVWRRRTSW
jgi:hypothetical protein